MKRRFAVIVLVGLIGLQGCATQPGGPGLQPMQPAVPAQRMSANGVPCTPLGGARNSDVANTAIGAGAGALAGAGLAAATGAHGRGTRNAALAGLLVGALAGSQYNNMVKPQDDGSVRMDIPGAVLFRTGSAEINPAFLPTLDKVAATVRDTCDITATVVGHTDSTGSVSTNERLSFDRANAVVQYLQGQRIGMERLRAEGHAAREPIASNADEGGRSQNRRVEIFIRPPGN